MKGAIVEHVNVTVTDADKTAALLCTLFDWKIRWQGDAILGGRTVHVGTDDGYLALYTPKKTAAPWQSSYEICGGLNHIGVVVDDLDAAERRVKAAGLDTHNHADYEPGRRFYFNGPDDVEYEVVAYN